MGLSGSVSLFCHAVWLMYSNMVWRAIAAGKRVTVNCSLITNYKRLSSLTVMCKCLTRLHLIYLRVFDIWYCVQIVMHRQMWFSITNQFLHVTFWKFCIFAKWDLILQSFGAVKVQTLSSEWNLHPVFFYESTACLQKNKGINWWQFD